MSMSSQLDASAQGSASLEKIQELLRTKDDTSRFVGLALLKSVLDSSSNLREDKTTVVQLWESISPSFLNRLLRTGTAAKDTRKDGKDMLDLAIAVLHTFTVLLPEAKRRDQALAGKIPLLVASLVQSSKETTVLTLQTLATLVSLAEGARAFNEVDDISPLVEIAPSHPLALDVLSLAWLNDISTDPEQRRSLRVKLDSAIKQLISSFKRTDAVTFLAFLSQLLRNVDVEILPLQPDWLAPVTALIHNLVSSKPTPAGREAYTHLAATLLQLFPSQASSLLFAPSTPRERDKPAAAYLLVSLLLVDLRASLPTLLPQLNSPSYSPLSARLASAYDILSSFIAHLVSDGAGALSSDHLLRLRRAVADALSATIEHLRERHDAAVAGAPGLDPSARAGVAHTTTSSSSATTPPARLTLTWDAASPAHTMPADPLVLAALRALGLWLREDDAPALRAEAGGLMDVFVALYAAGPPQVKEAVLVALEGVTSAADDEDEDADEEIRPRAARSSPRAARSSPPEAAASDRDPDVDADADDAADAPSGAELLLEHGGFGVLTEDLLAILRTPTPAAQDAARGIEVVRVLLPIVEAEAAGGGSGSGKEEWLSFVRSVAGWGVPDEAGEEATAAVVDDFRIAVLQLATAVLEGAPPGVRRRYTRAVSAVIGVAEQLLQRSNASPEQEEDLDGVLASLAELRMDT